MNGDEQARGEPESQPAGISLITEVRVINIGIVDFAQSLWAQGAPCVHVEWVPPEADEEEITNLLDRLL